MNFVLVFVLAFRRTLGALFSSGRNRQAIHERFRFILILNRRSGVSFILRFDFLSLRLFHSFGRGVSCLLERLILDSDTLCLENIEQFFVFGFNEIEPSFCCFCFLFGLSQEISKSSHLRVCGVRAMMCDMINRSSHAAGAAPLPDLFAHAGDTTGVLCQCIHKNIVVIVLLDDRGHLIVRAHSPTLNHTKPSRDFVRHQFALARQQFDDLRRYSG